jgi:RimJ/RimL family protein N-acetyltransferase
MVQLAGDLEIRRLYALCHPQNRSSVRVLQKAGFEFEGVLRRHTIFPNLDSAEPRPVLGPDHLSQALAWRRTTTVPRARDNAYREPVVVSRIDLTGVEV